MIKNIVFDIGNVLIRWQPEKIMAEFFPDKPEMLYGVFKSDIWYNLNLGVISKDQALQQYHQRLGLEQKLLERLWNKTLESLVPIEDTLVIFEKIDKMNMPLYSITDNIREIFDYVRAKYAFTHRFIDVVTSYDVGALKPSPKIYTRLLEHNKLKASECVFIDDIIANVEGARKMGMQGIHFTTAQKCQDDLASLGVIF